MGTIIWYRTRAQSWSKDVTGINLVALASLWTVLTQRRSGIRGIGAEDIYIDDTRS